MTETPVDNLVTFYHFGAAAAFGLLIGLQREFIARRASENRRDFAGARTHALIGLLGCSAAFLGDTIASTFVLPAVLLITGALLIVAYFTSTRENRPGMTSEVAAVIVFLVGAICHTGEFAIAAAVAVTTTVLLALKVQTRWLASHLTAEDVQATLTFAVLTLIVLPILPRTPIGPAPFDVLVPYKVWLMVVLISGISFVGYVLVKVAGPQKGVGITGLLGGMVSSTAVTLSFAQRSRTMSELSKPFALAILLAWTVMFARVLVEVAVINLALLKFVWMPMVLACIASFAYCAYLHFADSSDTEPLVGDYTNPFELGPALTFGAIYMLIIVVANLAVIHFGDLGVYVSSIASGLADVDAITLSMAELSRTGGVPPAVAARAIVLAAASNTLVKGGIVIVAGAPALRRVMIPGLLLTVGTAVGVVFFT